MLKYREGRAGTPVRDLANLGTTLRLGHRHLEWGVIHADTPAEFRESVDRPPLLKNIAPMPDQRTGYLSQARATLLTLILLT